MSLPPPGRFQDPFGCCFATATLTICGAACCSHETTDGHLHEKIGFLGVAHPHLGGGALLLPCPEMLFFFGGVPVVIISFSFTAATTIRMVTTISCFFFMFISRSATWISFPYKGLS